MEAWSVMKGEGDIRKVVWGGERYVIQYYILKSISNLKTGEDASKI